MTWFYVTFLSYHDQNDVSPSISSLPLTPLLPIAFCNFLNPKAPNHLRRFGVLQKSQRWIEGRLNYCNQASLLLAFSIHGNPKAPNKVDDLASHESLGGGLSM
ncbi:uncharacterized protein J3R85_012494 [Psidium guajava]|nr:uncharacterized protein J3R85_012494 [Psidium guajava]